MNDKTCLSDLRMKFGLGLELSPRELTELSRLQAEEHPDQTPTPSFSDTPLPEPSRPCSKVR
jgi:hypothetical protein